MTSQESEIISASEETTYFSWKMIGLYCVVLNAIAGILVLERTLAKSKRIMELPDEIWAKFPAFRRQDAKFWSRRNMYLGAATLLIPRLVSHFLITCLIGINCVFISNGHDFKDPITGVRKVLVALNF